MMIRGRCAIFETEKNQKPIGKTSLISWGALLTKHRGEVTVNSNRRVFSELIQMTKLIWNERKLRFQTFPSNNTLRICTD